MKICHIISGTIWAGAECQAANLLSGLVRHDALALSAITFYPGRLMREIEDLGVSVNCLADKEMSPLRQLIGIREHIDRHQIDVIHCHGHKEHILGCVATVLSKRRPRVVRTLHGMPEPFTGLAKVRADFFGWVQEFCFRHLTDSAIVVCGDMAQKHAERRWAGKIACIHNGIDYDRLRNNVSPAEMRKKLGIEEDGLIIGTACRLVPIKRMDLLLEAFRIVRQTHPRAVLVISGTGPLLGELKNVAMQLDIEPNVRFLGHRDDVHDVMSAFDLFAMTSEHEGVPMALLEALAFGVPVVAPEVGGIPEVCPKEGVTFYKQPSPAAVAESILKAVNGVGNGHAKCKPFRQFSVEATSSKTLDVYRSVTGNGLFRRGRTDNS